MVVAQLVERLLPNPEVHGSNPVIGKKTKIKKKRPGKAHLKKTFDILDSHEENFQIVSKWFRDRPSSVDCLLQPWVRIPSSFVRFL